MKRVLLSVSDKGTFFNKFYRSGKYMTVHAIFVDLSAFLSYNANVLKAV